MHTSATYAERMKGPGFLLAFLLLSTTAFAFNLPTDLRGIKKVNVMVADLPDDFVKAGVEKEALAATLQAALEAAGLTVRAQGQYEGTAPTVSLQVSAVSTPNGRFSATDIVLDCLDNVYNTRTAGPFVAVIWSRDVLQLLGAVDSGRVIDGEKKLIDMFLSDYSQANPK